MSTKEDPNIAKASDCEMKAKEALDLSVRRYFAQLARDYRRLAELTQLAQNRPSVPDESMA